MGDEARPPATVRYTAQMYEPLWFLDAQLQSKAVVDTDVGAGRECNVGDRGALAQAAWLFAAGRFADVMALARPKVSFMRSLGKQDQREWLDFAARAAAQLPRCADEPQCEDALSFARQRAALDNVHDVSGRKLCAEILCSRGSHLEARVILQTCIEDMPSSVRVWLLLACTYVAGDAGDVWRTASCLLHAECWQRLALRATSAPFVRTSCQTLLDNSCPSNSALLSDRICAAYDALPLPAAAHSALLVSERAQFAREALRGTIPAGSFEERWFLKSIDKLYSDDDDGVVAQLDV